MMARSSLEELLYLAEILKNGQFSHHSIPSLYAPKIFMCVKCQSRLTFWYNH